LFFLLNFLSIIIFGQNTIIHGSVKDAKTGEPVPAVSITVKDSYEGTFTSDKGTFSLRVNKSLPLTIDISSIGYKMKEITVADAASALVINLEPQSTLGQEVIVAATRTPTRIIESPVTIELVGAAEIRNTPGPGYYDALAYLKGVDVTSSSYTFKTISTRGFNGSGNLRFNQLVDGMNNSAPALNFSVGNVIGLTDLDVDHMELLSGASSALYGPGGLNGTLLIASKDPFNYQGFSAEVKEGVMHVKDYRHKASPFHDIALRWGKKVSDRFAFKIGAEYIKADDWQADDSTDLDRNNVLSKIKSGTRASDPNYDGVNIFGDEVNASMAGISQAFLFPLSSQLAQVYGRPPTYNEMINYINSQPGNTQLQQLLPFAAGLENNLFGNQLISRTGYHEADLVNYDAYDIKVSGGLYFKLSPKTEASLTGNFGQGTTVYTGSDRYSLKNFRIGQYKLEFKNPDWLLRAYTTQENSGDSYASTLAAIGINSAWKENALWLGQYVGTYSAYVLQGADPATAHAAARAAADQGRYLHGSSEFKSAFNTSINTPISKGGSQFADKSSLYQFEGQYHFSQFAKVLDILAGADYRTFHLNSKNTIFYEPNGPINIGEYGAYIQLQKSLLNDILKLSASGRYDKSENFQGRFTPRITASVAVAKDNNIRLSYQQASRFPDNQDQWINLQTPGTILIGCLPVFNDLYHFDTDPVYTAESVDNFRNSQNPADLRQASFRKAKPETMESYEIGYRGIIDKNLLVDAYYYFSTYKDFIAREAVARGASGNPSTSVPELASPFTSMNFSFVVNSPTPVKANGWGLSAEYNVGKGYAISGNVYQDQLSNVLPGLVTFFNTPKTRFKLGVSNSNTIGKGFGFNIMYKWQEKINWEGTFGSGEIPSFGTLDAQVNYKFTKQKILLKIGGTNITNHYYRNAFGNPYIGGLYYASIGYNVF
jgi:outer membrane receptor protein involved in Fe transport